MLYFLQTVCYTVIVFMFLLLQGIAMIFIGLYRVWEYFRYQLQILRYPPPPGGMYGNMARVYKNRRNSLNN